MNNEKNKQEILTALEIVVKNFLQPELIGCWISVRGHSVGNMCQEIGIGKHYANAIYEELKSIGLIEYEGKCAGMRFKIITNEIPDYSVVANKIYARHCEDIRNNKPMTRDKDLNPLRSKPRCSVESLDEQEIKKRKPQRDKDYSRIPHLGQTVFCLVNGCITEADITCVRFDESGKVKVDFKTPMFDENQVRIEKRDYCLRNIAFSVDELLKKLTSNIQRFKRNGK